MEPKVTAVRDFVAESKQRIQDFNKKFCDGAKQIIAQADDYVAGSFLLGAADGALENVTMGFAQSGAESKHPKAFLAGRITGDLLVTLYGVGEVLLGVGGEGLGVGLDATGVGAIAGVPINIASAGLIAHGGLMAYSGASNIGKDASDLVQAFKSSGGSNGPGKLKATKLSSEKIELDWLPDKYTAVEVKGTVKVSGKDVDVSRRVYQIDIDKSYVPKDPFAKGLTNEELMRQGKSPYVIKDGVESKVELHHLTQKEPGGMVEIAEITHDKYSSALHGLIEDGQSFRNNPELRKQYDNFRSNYWKMRANE